MKLVRKSAVAAADATPAAGPWTILVVDDEPDVRQVTALNLKDFRFDGRPLRLIEAASGAEARRLLAEHQDIAVALIDVVMESEDAGLKLVEAIRQDPRNALMRLIIRTGQPGVAPESVVIDRFDIDDYKDKTELTVQKLYTSVRSALKAYRDLQTLDCHRRSLESVLRAVPQVYQLRRHTLSGFLEGILTSIAATCRVSFDGRKALTGGVIALLEDDRLEVRAAMGSLDARGADADDRLASLMAQLGSTARSGIATILDTPSALVVPLIIRDEAAGLIYLEASQALAGDEKLLIRVLVSQVSAALENYLLHSGVRKLNDQLVETLAVVSEFKDTDTGAHNRRLSEYTVRIALELGLSEEQARDYGRAACLHDVGKIGIPDNILHKAGSLTGDEFEIIKRHARIGADILSRAHALPLARDIALGHHERWDGRGYPKGLSGQEISLPCRIVAVADVFDALISHRCYKDSWPPERAIAELVRSAGSQFDPTVVAALVSIYGRGDLADLLANLGND
ncbi:MAG: HD domain-containing response regulator [Rhodospirillaceae bacterium]